MFTPPATLASMQSLAPKTDFVGLEQVTHLATGGEAPFLGSHLGVLQRFAVDKSAGMAGRERILATADDTRRDLAGLLSCAPEDIGFANNVAQGVNMVVGSLVLEPGDNVVLERWEFPSVSFPWLRLQQRGVEVRLLDPEPGGWQAPTERLRQAIDTRTRVVAVSQVSYLSGERHDLAAMSALAHDAGALLLVDATHALGAVPVSAPHADFLFAACYKWILGTHGVAVAYWNRQRLPDWRPRDVGWHSVPHQPVPLPGQALSQFADGRVFELGNPAFIAIAVLRNAVAYVNRFGIEAIAAHVTSLSGHLRRGLVELGVDSMTPDAAVQRAGNIAFAVHDEAVWRHELEARGVLAWIGDGRVRLSTHLFNDQFDVEQALAAVAAIVDHRAATRSSSGV